MCCLQPDAAREYVLALPDFPLRSEPMPQGKSKRWEDMMLQRVSVAGRRVTQFTALILAFHLGPAVPARAQVANAVITGIVTDAQGGVLPGVTITVRNADSGVTRTIVTEANGRYRLGGIPPGRYNLTAELQGFAVVDVK